MTGRRAVIGLSLFCALLFSAFAAQGASAAGTTAVKCEASAATLPGFTDAHCDKAAAKAAEVKFKHVEITKNKAEAVSVTNAETTTNTAGRVTAVLHAKKLHGVLNVVIECEEVNSANSTLENKEGVGKVMFAEGGLELRYNKCKTNQAGCAVTTPIVVNGIAKTIEPGAAEMGLEVGPVVVGGNLTDTTLTGATCGLRFFPKMPVEGSIVVTLKGEENGVGATGVVTVAMSEKTLTWAGEPADLSQTTTTKLGASAVTLTTL